jgi:uncharacterized phage infection (PIP) family protein YhgE
MPIDKPTKSDESFLRRPLKKDGTLEELIDAHNKIQDDTETLMSHINDSFNKTEKALMEEIEKIIGQLKKGADRFEAHETRIEKLEEGERIRSKMNGKRDEKVSDLKKDFNKKFDNLHTEIGEMRKEINENRTERRQDIDKLGINFDLSFNELKQTLNEDKRENIKFVGLLFGASMSVIVPIVIALIYIFFTHIGGR